MSALFSFSNIYQAYRQCLRGKQQTRNAQRYQLHLLDNLWETLWQLQQYRWTLGHAIFFIALKPKVREIHAADFSDRVVHHLIVPELEALFEPVFIFDCYSNRKDKGTHKAVKRLQSYMKSHLDKTYQGQQGQSFFLQLDVKNFFNSIDKPLLFQLINQRLKKAIQQGKISRITARNLSWCVKQLLKPRSDKHIIKKGPAWVFEQVPEHKRLNHHSNKGLPIGNLTSQFFANVYLNELDQFVKHQLKCQAYIRYVDDMILVHHDPCVLQHWQHKIATFLQEHLHLSLRPLDLLKPSHQGADFLGYIVRPGYILVRRRVVANLEEKLNRFQGQMIVHKQTHELITLSPSIRDSLRATLSSYLGHFKHANSLRLIDKIKAQYPWLTQLFIFHLKGNIAHQGIKIIPRWQPVLVSSLKSQWCYFKKLNTPVLLIMQVGCVYELYDKDAHFLSHYLKKPLTDKNKTNRYFVNDCFKVYKNEIKHVMRQLRQAHIAYQLIVEEGYLPGGMKRRVLRQVYQSSAPCY